MRALTSSLEGGSKWGPGKRLLRSLQKRKNVLALMELYEQNIIIRRKIEY